MGPPPPAGPDIAECRAPAAVDVLPEKEEGRFKKARHTLVVRHLESSISLIVLRYVSSACRRSSVSCGFDTVFANHDFPGNEQGGGEPTWSVSPLCRTRKSE
jgi:hypothetical protein